MIEFRPFEPEDLIGLEMQEFQKNVEEVVAHDEEHGKYCMLSELSLTGIYNGRIIGCAGIMRQTAFKGQCWMALTDIPRRAWPAIVAETRKILERAHDLGMVRLWAEVQLNHLAGERFLQKLGFEPEGIMKNNGPCLEHQVLYAKIRLGES